MAMGGMLLRAELVTASSRRLLGLRSWFCAVNEVAREAESVDGRVVILAV